MERWTILLQRLGKVLPLTLSILLVLGVAGAAVYEWQKPDKNTKIPHRFIMKDRKLFTMAGLWDVWKKDSDPLYTFTIITTSDNELMKPIHDRMPVILPKENRIEKKVTST